MDQTRSSSLSQVYNDFLFATVCEDANGTQMTVLSALARIDVDPWEEAARLAALPKVTAARTLISMLDHACGKNDDIAEADATAARLVRLLPHPGSFGALGLAPEAAAGAIKDPLQSPKASLQTYWWVWVGLALVVSFITPRPDAAENPAMAQTEVHQPMQGVGAAGPQAPGAAPAVASDLVTIPVADGVPIMGPGVAPPAASSPIAYSR